MLSLILSGFYTQTSPFASKLGIVGQKFGLFDVLIPFLLIFGIVYAVALNLPFLQSKDAKGKKNTKIATVLALVIALLFLYPHIAGYPPEQDPVAIIMEAVPASSQVFILILLALVTAGMVGFSSLGTEFTKWALFAALIAISLIFANALGWLNNLPAWASFVLTPEWQDLLIILLVFGLIVYFVTSPSKPADADSAPTKFMKYLFTGANKNESGSAANPPANPPTR